MKKLVLRIGCVILLISIFGGRIVFADPLSAHFSRKEFQCKCCSDIVVSGELLVKLEALRIVLGRKPIIITSGYRCPKHNKEVGGVKNSQHMFGNAADIKVKGVSPRKVGRLAKEVGFSYIKVYRSWVHVDVRR